MQEDTLTITLREPITVAGETTSYVCLREPVISEIERFIKDAAKNGEVSAMKLLITAVSGVSPFVVDKMKARDFMAANKFLGGFFDLPPENPVGEA